MPGLTSTFISALVIDPAIPVKLYAGPAGGGVFVFQEVVDNIPQYSVYSDNTTYKIFPGAVDSYTMGAFLIHTTAPNRSVSVGNLPAASPNDTKTIEPYIGLECCITLSIRYILSSPHLPLTRSRLGKPGFSFYY